MNSGEQVPGTDRDPRRDELLYKDNNYDVIREASCRTSIGRAYYSSFLILRKIIMEEIHDLNGIIDRVMKSGLVHSCIKRIVGIAIDRFAEQIYSRLLYLRRLADYDMEVRIDYITFYHHNSRSSKVKLAFFF